mmetsp:Transcript_30122/g.75259  ORF Transcript_30122/g.75259 Transcript_30122/m.75259 type:complete len:227 (-) Transcript_30122:409-1089(-)
MQHVRHAWRSERPCYGVRPVPVLISYSCLHPNAEGVQSCVHGYTPLVPGSGISLHSHQSHCVRAVLVRRGCLRRGGQLQSGRYTFHGWGVDLRCASPCPLAMASQEPQTGGRRVSVLYFTHLCTLAGCCASLRSTNSVQGRKARTCSRTSRHVSWLMSCWVSGQYRWLPSNEADVGNDAQDNDDGSQCRACPLFSTLYGRDDNSSRSHRLLAPASFFRVVQCRQSK